jgi:hypothetical protein
MDTQTDVIAVVASLESHVYQPVSISVSFVSRCCTITKNWRFIMEAAIMLPAWRRRNWVMPCPSFVQAHRWKDHMLHP